MNLTKERKKSALPKQASKHRSKAESNFVATLLLEARARHPGFICRVSSFEFLQKKLHVSLQLRVCNSKHVWLQKNLNRLKMGFSQDFMKNHWNFG